MRKIFDTTGHIAEIGTVFRPNPGPDKGVEARIADEKTNRMKAAAYLPGALSHFSSSEGSYMKLIPYRLDMLKNPAPKDLFLLNPKGSEDSSGF